MYAQNPQSAALFGTTPTAPEETWFVAFGPDDVRPLSLEQLDDAYRLDVINDETLVQSSSMGSWVPLGVVLGEEEEVAPSTQQSPAVYDDRGLFGRTPAPQYAPASVAPASLAPAPALLAPVIVTSMAPTAFDVAQYQLPRREPSRSGWLAPFILAAVVAGGLAVGYRTGVAAQLAGRFGVAGQYTQLTERAFGAPGMDTPAGTQAFLDNMERTYGLSELASLGVRHESGTVTASASTPVAPAAEEVAAPAEPSAEAANDVAGVAGAAAPVDIDSLPPAKADEAKADAPSRMRAALVATPKAERASASGPPRHLHLDTEALRQALERSKAAKKKSGKNAAQEYDPLFNSQK